MTTPTPENPLSDWKRSELECHPAKCTTNVPPTEEREQELQPEVAIRTNDTTGLFLAVVRCHDEDVFPLPRIF